MKKVIVKYFLFAVLVISITSCTKSCEKSKVETKDIVPKEEQKKEEVKEEPSVFFINPQNNAQVSSPVTVQFGLKGMSIKPAMEDINDKTSGHHHLLIDHPQGFIEAGQVIPEGPNLIHYGKGETSAVIELSPGIHTLSLQFGDGAHISYGKGMSSTITITVVAKQ